MTSAKILVTGAAGFIGFHLSKRLLTLGHSVVGLDNLNDYYDVGLKESRLSIIKEFSNFSFYKADLQHKQSIDELFEEQKFEYVVLPSIATRDEEWLLSDGRRQLRRQGPARARLHGPPALRALPQVSAEGRLPKEQASPDAQGVDGA